MWRLSGCNTGNPSSHYINKYELKLPKKHVNPLVIRLCVVLKTIAPYSHEKSLKTRFLSKEDLGISSALFVPKISVFEFANSISIWDHEDSGCFVYFRGKICIKSCHIPFCPCPEDGRGDDELLSFFLTLSTQVWYNIKQNSAI